MDIICMCCRQPRDARAIEEDGACDLCHIAGVDDPAVGTEFDLDIETAASWRRDIAALRALDAQPANDRAAVTAPMRAAGGAR